MANNRYGRAIETGWVWLGTMNGALPCCIEVEIVEKNKDEFMWEVRNFNDGIFMSLDKIYKNRIYNSYGEAIGAFFNNQEKLKKSLDI